MGDFIIPIIATVIGAIVGAVLAPIVSSAFCWIGHRITWPWRRYRACKAKRRAEREQRLNQIVHLTTGEDRHRGCADSEDQVIEPGPNERIVGLGTCKGCGEHLGRPRAG